MEIKTYHDLIKSLDYKCNKCNQLFEINYKQKYNGPYEFYDCPNCMEEYSFLYIEGGIKIGDSDNSNLLVRTIFKW